MQIRNSNRSWGIIQQGLHWFVVIAAISQLTIGLIFGDLPENDPRRGTLFRLHATLGVTILLVMLVRFAWRQANPVPALPDTLKPFERGIAIATHWAFYLLLIGLPLGGYLMVNAHGSAVPFFGGELPRLIGKSEAANEVFGVLHVWGAYSLMGLIALHAAAALRHEFLLRDNTLRRMTPLPERDAEPAGHKRVGEPISGRSAHRR